MYYSITSTVTPVSGYNTPTTISWPNYTAISTVYYRSEKEDRLVDAINRIKRRMGIDLTPLLKDIGYDRKTLASLATRLLWEQREREAVLRAERLRVIRRQRPVRRVVKRARVCGTSSRMSAMPPHARCPR